MTDYEIAENAVKSVVESFKENGMEIRSLETIESILHEYHDCCVWIPCEERLPKYDQRVAVMVGNKEHYTFVMSSGRMFHPNADGKFGCGDFDAIAWSAIPKA